MRKPKVTVRDMRPLENALVTRPNAHTARPVIQIARHPKRLVRGPDGMAENGSQKDFVKSETCLALYSARALLTQLHLTIVGQ